jgi:hypothetical protein
MLRLQKVKQRAGSEVTLCRDVIKTGTSETKTKTKTGPVKTKTKTGPIETKTKTTKKWSWTVSRPRPGLETNISVIKFDYMKPPA